MKIIRYLRGQAHNYKLFQARRRLRAQYAGEPLEITRAHWPESLQDPTAFYARCCHYFDRCLPAEFRQHRAYFNRRRRGFGEDAFHTQWYWLFREFRPQSFLEIGIFRGQSLSLAAMLARHFKLDCPVHGISPFSTDGDSVSYYLNGVDFHADTLHNFAHFSLPPPALLRAYSTDETARALIASRLWSLIYIDGNHEYDVARQDWEMCARHIAPGGVIVLDDAGLGTNYRPPGFATGGHPGPSRLAKEINSTQFKEILQVGHNRAFQKIA